VDFELVIGPCISCQPCLEAKMAQEVLLVGELFPEPEEERWPDDILGG